VTTHSIIQSANNVASCYSSQCAGSFVTISNRLVCLYCVRCIIVVYEVSYTHTQAVYVYWLDETISCVCWKQFRWKWWLVKYPFIRSFNLHFITNTNGSMLLY